jgi:hypothetical protein
LADHPRDGGDRSALRRGVARPPRRTPGAQRPRAAVTVAGAQAVYLRAGEAEIGIAPYTTDGDLAIDPAILRDEPQLESAMGAAHFTRSLTEPGIWLATTTVDGEELTIQST